VWFAAKSNHWNVGRDVSHLPTSNDSLLRLTTMLAYVHVECIVNRFASRPICTRRHSEVFLNKFNVVSACSVSYLLEGLITRTAAVCSKSFLRAFQPAFLSFRFCIFDCEL
jgi:hypothetical protein